MNSSVNKKGFTLVELMLAMAIFISVLMIFTFGFIGISRTFSRGILRKQLSESVQITTDNLTKAIRAGNVNSLPIHCNDSTPECADQISPSGWQAVCFGADRFFWNPNIGGLYHGNSSCDTDIQTDEARQVVDTKFRVDALEINALNNTSSAKATSLFEVRGVIRTKDNAAFSFDTEIPADPYKTKCRGTTESNTVRSCAIENFSFIVNSRGDDS